MMHNENLNGQLEKARRSSARDALLISMLAHYGVKSGELLQLKGRHVDLGEKTVTLGERSLELSEDIVEMLEEVGSSENAYVFKGRKGPLTARHLQMITKKHLGKTPNELRREFARGFVGSGGKARELQRHLGHAKLETTMRLLE